MSDIQTKYKEKIITFTLDGLCYALYLSVVQRVVAAVEITPLPKAPEIVMGIINFHGQIIPVMDMRKRFRLPVREIGPDDQFIIAQTSKRLVALVADSVTGIRDCSDIEIIETGTALPYADYLAGVAILEDNLVLINDLDKFLSTDEDKMLEEATHELITDG